MAAVDEVRVCTGCGMTKDTASFYTKGKRSGKQRFHSKCVPCFREDDRESAVRRYHANPEAYRNRHLLRMYGISLDDYRRMLERQGFRCAICDVTECPSGKSLAVDHDHATGEVRGLLCANCNHGIGKFKDSPSMLRAAASYLEGVTNVL